MSEVSFASREAAHRMLLIEASGRTEPEALAAAAERVNARLRLRLASLFGLTGYAFLVARAVRLAQVEVPDLNRVTVTTLETGAEGSLHGIREFALAHGGDSGRAEAGLSALLAHIVGLLATFIGEELALRLASEAWPELANANTNVERREGRA